MRKALFVLAAAVLVAALATTSYAGELRGRLKAEVPFDFMAGTTKMAAGTYYIEQHPIVSVLMVRAETAKPTIAVQVNPVRTGRYEAQQARLVFNRYGDRYFLAQVWGTTGEGHQLRKTKIEREMASVQREEATVLASMK